MVLKYVQMPTPNFKERIEGTVKDGAGSIQFEVDGGTPVFGCLPYIMAPWSHLRKAVLE